jgi:hypothetical protein
MGVKFLAGGKNRLYDKSKRAVGRGWPLEALSPIGHRLPTVLLSTRKEKSMTNREKVLGEVFELALQNDMTYFG